LLPAGHDSRARSTGRWTKIPLDGGICQTYAR
jgi:hypothetical protein